MGQLFSALLKMITVVPAAAAAVDDEFDMGNDDSWWNPGPAKKIYKEYEIHYHLRNCAKYNLSSIVPFKSDLEIEKYFAVIFSRQIKPRLNCVIHFIFNFP